jgi:uncharacterized iron-regulated membrane protein
MRGFQAIVKRIHLTLGLILALPVFILGISGSVLVLDIHPRVPQPAHASHRIARHRAPRAPVFAFAHRLHETFLAGRPGRMAVGVFGAGMIVLGLTGPIAWWPGRRRLREGVTVRRSAGPWRTLRDAHRAVGIITLIFFLIVTVSGTHIVFWPGPADGPAGFMRPLHQGQMLGLPWKVALFLTGVLPPFFAVTGVAMAIAKRRARVETKRLVGKVGLEPT